MPEMRRPARFDVAVVVTYQDGTSETKNFQSLSEVVFAGVEKEDGKMKQLHLEVHSPPGGVMYLTELIRQQHVVREMQFLIAQSEAMRAAEDQRTKLALPGDADVAAIAARMARQRGNGK